MNDLSSFIPKNKSDLDSVHKLEQLGYPKISPILQPLLKWVQDINWPVAYPLAGLLASVGQPLVPHLVEILRGDDGAWKYWCIVHVIQPMAVEARRSLRPELEHLVQSPSENDKREEVDLVAKEALDELV
jgi:hypothetical protein